LQYGLKLGIEINHLLPIQVIDRQLLALAHY